MTYNTKMHRSIVPTFRRIVLNRNPAQKQKYQKAMNEQVSQITARQLKADYLCKLTMPSVPTHLTPDKIPKTSPHPSEQILLILSANVYTQIPRYREI